MILNLVVVLIIVGSAAAWGSKARGFGLFSAFLCLVCVLAAGAVAFAAWEPAAAFLLSKDAGTGVTRMLADNAWGLGLLLPFVVCLFLLRLGVDSFVGANLEFSNAANMVGGGVFGAAAGFITSGVVVLGLSFMRLPPAVMGYQAVADQSGAMTFAGDLWIPAPSVVGSMYSHLSLGGFASSTPMAHYQPAVHEQAGMLRMTYEGKSRVSVKPDEVEVVGRYEMPGALNTILTDGFIAGKVQRHTYPDGSAPPEGSTLQGYVVRFRSGAKEKSGSVVLTPGQIRLVFKEENGARRGIHPVAVVAPPEAAGTGLYRFRFDSKEPFIASLGGGSEAIFGFEFVVPPGATPESMLIKNNRRDITGVKTRPPFKNVIERDGAVLDGSIFGAFGVGPAVLAAPSARASSGGGGGAAAAGGSPAGGGGGGDGGIIRIAAGGRIEGVTVTPQLPFSLALKKDTVGGLELGPENAIRAGSQKFDKESVSASGLGRDLRVDRFEKAKDTAIVQVTMSDKGSRSMFGRAVEAAEDLLPPLLVDDAGRSYEAIGFVYMEGNEVEIRFTPDRPIRAIAEMPTLSRGKRDQTLTVIFRPTAKVKIVSFRLGSREIAQFEGGLEAF